MVFLFYLSLRAFTSSGFVPVMLDMITGIEAAIVPINIMTTSLLESNTGNCNNVIIIPITNRKINNDPTYERISLATPFLGVAYAYFFFDFFA